MVDAPQVGRKVKRWTFHLIKSSSFFNGDGAEYQGLNKAYYCTKHMNYCLFMFSTNKTRDTEEDDYNLLHILSFVVYLIN